MNHSESQLPNAPSSTEPSRGGNSTVHSTPSLLADHHPTESADDAQGREIAAKKDRKVEKKKAQSKPRRKAPKATHSSTTVNPSPGAFTYEFQLNLEPPSSRSDYPTHASESQNYEQPSQSYGPGPTYNQHPSQNYWPSNRDYHHENQNYRPGPTQNQPQLQMVPQSAPPPPPPPPPPPLPQVKYTLNQFAPSLSPPVTINGGLYWSWSQFELQHLLQAQAQREKTRLQAPAPPQPSGGDHWAYGQQQQPPLFPGQSWNAAQHSSSSQLKNPVHHHHRQQQQQQQPPLSGQSWNAVQHPSSSQLKNPNAVHHHRQQQQQRPHAPTVMSNAITSPPLQHPHYHPGTSSGIPSSSSTPNLSIVAVAASRTGSIPPVGTYHARVAQPQQLGYLPHPTVNYQPNPVFPTSSDTQTPAAPLIQQSPRFNFTPNTHYPHARPHPHPQDAYPVYPKSSSSFVVNGSQARKLGSVPAQAVSPHIQRPNPFVLPSTTFDFMYPLPTPAPAQPSLVANTESSGPEALGEVFDGQSREREEEREGEEGEGKYGSIHQRDETWQDEPTAQEAQFGEQEEEEETGFVNLMDEKQLEGKEKEKQEGSIEEEDRYSLFGDEKPKPGDDLNWLFGDEDPKDDVDSLFGDEKEADKPAAELALPGFHEDVVNLSHHSIKGHYPATNESLEAFAMRNIPPFSILTQGDASHPTAPVLSNNASSSAQSQITDEDLDRILKDCLDKLAGSKGKPRKNKRKSAADSPAGKAKRRRHM